MNAIYFAVACIVMMLVIYWGSAKPEPERLARFFGQRAPSERPDNSRNKWRPR